MANVLRSKFRGCLLGALFGDALGALFEGDYWGMPVPLQRFDELSTEKLSARNTSGNLLNYTDDTAMTKCLCRSLLSKQSFDVSDLAKGFVEEYFHAPFRGYGSGVITVFERLRTGNYEGDIMTPSREQFDGTGSYGNGAAMRVAPLAPFYFNDLESLMKDSRTSALITHSHILGIHGAILQAIAVYEALNTSPGTLDVAQYIDKLINTARTLEINDGGSPADHQKEANLSADCKDGDKVDEKCSYVTQFQNIKAMLLDKEDGSPRSEEVIKSIGHGVKAVEAVPAAIFSFLYNSNTCLKEAVFYAISLGGDTDTIASMTGAIAGAYWGDECIPEEWFGATESVNETIEFANQLYDLRAKKQSNCN